MFDFLFDCRKFKQFYGESFSKQWTGRGGREILGRVRKLRARNAGSTASAAVGGRPRTECSPLRKKNRVKE